MSGFATLARDYAGMTWDYPVECSETITKEERVKICRLGYYGKPIKESHVAMLENGQPFKADAPYAIIYSGCDGRDFMEYKTLEEAKAYILPRIEWCRSNTGVGTEFASYTLEGFTLSDIGVNWRDHQA